MAGIRLMQAMLLARALVLQSRAAVEFEVSVSISKTWVVEGTST